MAGWESNDSDIYVESIEEIIDDNPDLYKQRTIAALNEKRYSDALKEAQLALKYGNNALEYHVLIVRVLFEVGQYEACMQYIKGSGLWDNREDKRLLYDEQNFIYYAYGICYRECGNSLINTDLVIVTPDGKGMYKTLQEAISWVGKNQVIFLTGGCYFESVLIKNKEIKIFSNENFVAKLTKPLMIQKSDVVLDGLQFFSKNEQNTFMLAAIDSKCSFCNLLFEGTSIGDGSLGISLENCFDSNLRKLEFRKTSIAATIESKEMITIQDSTFSNNTVALLCVGECVSKIYCINLKFIRNEVGIAVGGNGVAQVYDSFFDYNKKGVSVFKNIEGYFEFEDGKSGIAFIGNCEINHSGFAGIEIKDNSSTKVKSCKFTGGKNFAISISGKSNCELMDCFIQNNLKSFKIEDQSRVDKINVKELNNDLAGRAIEGVKGIWNVIKNL